MFDFTPVATAVVTAFAALIVWFIQEKRREKALAAKQETVMEKAIVVLIRNQIVTAHRSSIKRWSITTAELQSYREMHDLYVRLGGNGHAAHLLSDVERVKLTAD